MTDTSQTVSPTADWHYPTAIRFGAGRIVELPDACREAELDSPLLVTDQGLAELPMVTEAVAACRAVGLGCSLFGGIRSNPTLRNVEIGLAAFRAGNHDGVIAFGGGSALDAGKAIALMVGQGRPIWDFEDVADWHTRVDARGMAPVVALPTTSGTGSEVGRAAVITDRERAVKKIIFHPNMLPGRVIADPALTLGLPAGITAATGMDALSHNLEAFCAPGYHPMADGIALEGMRLVHDWLPLAVGDGANLEARSHMMVASSMGATAFQKGLGAMHGMSHPVGAVLGAHHGLTNAVVMPYVLAFNRAAIAPRLAALARYLGLAEPSFEAVQEWVLGLRAEIGIPHTLAELGVAEDQVEELAAKAAADPSTATNPVALDAADYRRLYRDAIRGALAA